jgi:bifunctional non-homologous end joining protein LigD
VAPYAVRSIKTAPIATPLDWDELSEKNFNARKYTMNNIFQRLGNKKDPWRNFNSKATSIKDL